MHSIFAHAATTIRNALTGGSQDRPPSRTDADSLRTTLPGPTADTVHGLNLPDDSLLPSKPTKTRAPEPDDDKDWVTPKMRPPIRRGGFKPTNTLDQPAPHSARRPTLDPDRPFRVFLEGKNTDNHVDYESRARPRHSDGVVRRMDFSEPGSPRTSKRRRLCYNPASPGLQNGSIEDTARGYGDVGEIVARNKKPLPPGLTHQSPSRSAASQEKRRAPFANTELSNVSKYTSVDHGKKRKKGRESPVSQTAMSSRTPSIVENSHPRLSLDSQTFLEELDPSRHIPSSATQRTLDPPGDQTVVDRHDLPLSKSTYLQLSDTSEKERVLPYQTVSNKRPTSPQIKYFANQQAHQQHPKSQTARPVSRLGRDKPTLTETRGENSALSDNFTSLYDKRTNPVAQKSSMYENALGDSLSSTDELAGEATVTRGSPRKKSPKKRQSAVEHNVMVEKSRSASPSDLRRTEFSNLQDSSPLGHTSFNSKSDSLTVEANGTLRILVKSIYCLACVMQNVSLMWDDEAKGFHIDSEGHRVPVPGTSEPVFLGKHEVRSWTSSQEKGCLSVYLSGGRTGSSNGHIVIQFASIESMDVCLALLSETAGLEIKAKDHETITRVVNKQAHEISAAFRKNKEVALRKDVTSQNPNLKTVEFLSMQGQLVRKRTTGSEEVEEIKYEEDRPPPPSSLRKQMQSKHFSFPRAGAETKMASSSTNNRITSPFFDDRRRSSRQTRSREKSPPRPSPVRWTKTNQPKPWKQPIIYPTEGKERVTVAFEDLERLDEGEFLNDNVIAFALRQIQENMAAEHREKVYFFNSFFYTWLMHKSGKKQFDYAAVRRWTKNKDIFSYPYLVVPINVDLHWFVAIICNLPNLPRKASGLDDGDATEHERQVRSVELDGDHLSMEVHDSQERNTDGHKEHMPVVEVDDSQPDVVDVEKEPHVLIDVDNSQPSGIVVIPVQAALGQQDEGAKTGRNGFVSQNHINRGQRGVEVVDRPSTATSRKGRKRTAPPIRGFDPDKPAIVSLDSFGMSRQNEIKNLKLYLQAEALEKRAISLDTNELQGMTAKGIPEQSNFSDCGLYMIRYIEEFAKDPRNFISRVMTRQMDKQRDFESFDPTAKRAEIRNVLLGLADFA